MFNYGLTWHNTNIKAYPGTSQNYTVVLDSLHVLGLSCSKVIHWDLSWKTLDLNKLQPKGQFPTRVYIRYFVVFLGANKSETSIWHFFLLIIFFNTLDSSIWNVTKIQRPNNKQAHDTYLFPRWRIGKIKACTHLTMRLILCWLGCSVSIELLQVFFIMRVSCKLASYST